MAKKLNLVVIFSLFALILGPLPTVSADFNVASNGAYELSEVLVKFKGNPQIEKISLAPGESVLGAVSAYESRADVEFAEPNYKMTAEAITMNDPYIVEQWYLDKVRVWGGWEKTSGSPETVIAVLDTGVDLDHPDLKDNIWVNKGEVPNDGADNDGNIYVDDVNGWDFVAGDNNPRPDFKEWWFTKEGIDHGTIIAGVAAAVGNNARGIAGVAWKSKIMSVRVLDSAGSGDVLTVIEGIDYAVEKGADVINLSFIGSGFSKSLFLALERAYNAGVIVVAAVGNQGGAGKDLDEEPLYPVCYYGGDGENVVIGVAATDKDDKKAEFSNYGTKCVDVSAPGVDIWSTVAYNPGMPQFTEYYSGGWSGSSVAAPLVAGTAALIKSLNPNLGVPEVRNLLTVNADNIDSLNPEYAGKLGKGRLNITRTIEAAALTVESSPFALRRGNIFVAPASALKPEVKIFKEDSSFLKSFLAYTTSFLGGVSLASGDLNGDGAGEIITGAGPGGGPHVRIFRQDGTPVSGFMAYITTFRGGVNVAAGDVDGDGKSEIITGAGPGGGPHVRIFRQDGTPIGGFMAFPTTFRGGVNVAAGDVDGDGKADIIVAPGNGLEPMVKVFDSRGNLNTQFLAFEKEYKNGLRVAAGDTDGDQIAEIAVTKMSNGGEVRIYGQYVTLKLKFSPFTNLTGGVTLALGDLDGDKVSEIIVGGGPGSGPQIKIYNNKGFLRKEFFSFSQDFKGGINVGVIR
ncbi:S8 family serine peptidase [Candidatus Falkowbacteria bacterium]|nr:S8 family serine peptidase [Candidatus Falkowbacteria bacterium]